MAKPRLVDPAGIPIAERIEPGPHHVMMIFPNDHGLDGAKVSIVGVTPQQIAVAIMYLARSADRMMDAAEIMAMRAADAERMD